MPRYRVVNNLSDFIFGMVNAVGIIMLGIGIVLGELAVEILEIVPEGEWLLCLCGRRGVFLCQENSDPIMN